MRGEGGGELGVHKGREEGNWERTQIYVLLQKR